MRRLPGVFGGPKYHPPCFAVRQTRTRRTEAVPASRSRCSQARARHFLGAHSGGEGEDERRGLGVFARLGDERLGLFGEEKFNLLLRALGALGVGGRVEGEEAPADGLVERVREDGVGVLDGAAGEPAVAQGVVEFLDVQGRDGGEAAAPEEGADVAVELLLVVVEGAGLDGAACALGEPLVEVLAEGHAGGRDPGAVVALSLDFAGVGARGLLVPRDGPAVVDGLAFGAAAHEDAHEPAVLSASDKLCHSVILLPTAMKLTLD